MITCYNWPSKWWSRSWSSSAPCLSIRSRSSAPCLSTRPWSSSAPCLSIRSRSSSAPCLSTRLWSSRAPRLSTRPRSFSALLCLRAHRGGGAPHMRGSGLRLRGAARMMLSTRRIISAASEALTSTCCLTRYDSVMPSAAMSPISPRSMSAGTNATRHNPTFPYNTAVFNLYMFLYYKVGRACWENGRRSPDKDSRCVPRGRQEKRKTAIEMGGLREEMSGMQE